MADDVYLKIVPLTLDDSGQLSFSEKGVTVDWLVKMRRLPDSDMLDYQIMHHTVQPKKLYQFAVRLINFYQQATPVILTPEVYLYFFKNIIEENSKELIKKIYGLNAKQIKKLTHILENFLMTQKTLLDDRVLKHKIIEAHGDLKPEHVYLGPTPFIIDCLEFKREFRILDPLDELAFFAMECEKLNAGYIGDTLFKVYEEILEDQIPKNLVAFYKTHRAFLRARLVIRHLAEPQYQKDQDKWREKTKQYLELAEKYASDLINY